MPTALPLIEYDSSNEVRRVQQDGRLYFRGQVYRLSKAFTGYPIALRPTSQDAIVGVWFCNHNLGYINLHQNQYTCYRPED